MVKVFLAPRVLWNKDDFYFDDNDIKNFLDQSVSSWGIVMEFPVLPAIGSKICLNNYGEECYQQLRQYLRQPSSYITKLVNSYRFHKNIKDEELSWGESDPNLGLYANEDLLAALCHSRLADSICAPFWTVTDAVFIPNSEIVFLECEII